MININNIICNAFQRCSLVGDGMVPTDTQAAAGLQELNSLINELNAQNLLLDNVETRDIAAAGKFRIAELPEGMYIAKNYLDLSNMVSMPDFGNIAYLTDLDNFVFYGDVNNTPGWIYATDDQEKEILKFWPEIPLVNEALPDRLQGLGRKIGQRFIQLIPAERQFIDGKNKSGLPNFFATETEDTEFHFVSNDNNVDVTYEFLYLVIRTDTMNSVNYRATYLKNVKNMELTDNLNMSKKYESLLEDGLCAKLCLRYKLLDVKPMFDDEYRNQVSLIKRINKANRPIIYSDLVGDSWYDRYANGMAGFGW